MKFADIVQILSKDFDIHPAIIDGEEEILEIKLIDPRDVSASPGTLFFGYDNQSMTLPMNCILAGEQPRTVSLPEMNHPAGEPTGTDALPQLKNLAWIRPEDFSSIFNEVQDLLTNRKQNAFYAYIMDVADRVHSVDTLIDVASQSFGASLIFIDRDFRILSYSTQVPVTDPLWSNNISRGYCDYEFITEVRKLKAIQMADSSSNPIEVTCKSSPFRKLASRVYCRDTWTGFIILIENDDSYRPSHVEMLRILSGVIGYSVMKYSPEMLYHTNAYRSFLHSLLIGAPLSAQPEAYQKLPFPDRIQLFYMTAESKEKALPSEAYLSSRLGEILPNCHILSSRDYAIVIGSADDLTDPHCILTLFPPQIQVCTGISNVFHDIRNLRTALNEAEDALEAGMSVDPGRRFYYFEEFGVYVMIRNQKKREDIRRYIHPAIPLLKTYDNENDSQLVETLSEYLRCNNSIKDTADALFLHRNSVIYRLKKIEEVGQIRLDDVHTRFLLQLSFLILTT